jgi:hypothetical protein
MAISRLGDMACAHSSLDRAVELHSAALQHSAILQQLAPPDAKACHLIIANFVAAMRLKFALVLKRAGAFHNALSQLSEGIAELDESIKRCHPCSGATHFSASMHLASLRANCALILESLGEYRHSALAACLSAETYDSSSHEMRHFGYSPPCLPLADALRTVASCAESTNQLEEACIALDRARCIYQSQGSAEAYAEACEALGSVLQRRGTFQQYAFFRYCALILLVFNHVLCIPI